MTQESRDLVHIVLSARHSHNYLGVSMGGLDDIPARVADAITVISSESNARENAEMEQVNK